MSEETTEKDNYQGFGLTLIVAVTVGIVCTLLGAIILCIARLPFKSKSKLTIAQCFWVGLIPFWPLVLSIGKNKDLEIGGSSFSLRVHDYDINDGKTIVFKKPPTHESEIAWKSAFVLDVPKDKRDLFLLGEKDGKNTTFKISTNEDKVETMDFGGAKARKVLLSDGRRILKPGRNSYDYVIKGNTVTFSYPPTGKLAVKWKISHLHKLPKDQKELYLHGDVDGKNTTFKISTNEETVKSVDFGEDNGDWVYLEEDNDRLNAKEYTRKYNIKFWNVATVIVGLLALLSFLKALT